MKKISVVIPMYYEEEMVNTCYKELKRVLSKLKNYDYEMIFVNDGSLDKTLPLLTKIAKSDKDVKIISLLILLFFKLYFSNHIFFHLTSVLRR